MVERKKGSNQGNKTVEDAKDAAGPGPVSRQVQRDLFKILDQQLER